MRERVEEYIDQDAWERVETANRAVGRSLGAVMKGWSQKATRHF